MQRVPGQRLIEDEIFIRARATRVERLTMLVIVVLLCAGAGVALHAGLDRTIKTLDATVHAVTGT